jgi:Secretion system C-terminal sorting domain
MKTKIFLTVVALLCVSNLIYSQNKDGYKKYAHNQYTIKLNGDALGGEKIVNYFNPKDFNVVKPVAIQESSDNPSPSVVITDIGGRTIYDLVSNGSPVTIWQDPNTQDNIHAICISSPLNDTLFTNKQAKYYLSTDKGVTWSFIADVPTLKSSFPTITGMSDGSALVANYSIDGGGLARTQVYKDASAGLGSFTRLDPPNGTGYLWPRIVTTSSLVLSNKFLLVASTPDTTRYNVCTNVNSTPGSWLGWQTINYAEQVETYAIARGPDGRLGIAFLNDNSSYPANYGDVYFIESTNNGTSFSSPLKIFDANFSTDSLAGFRGISIVYSVNIPCIAFETVKQTTANTYFPGAPSKIRFWSSVLTGNDPNRSIVIADQSNITFYPYVGVNDMMAPLCRPVIGNSANNSRLFVVFMATSNAVGGASIPTSFKDIRISYGTPYGYFSNTPMLLNPISPRKDWTYPSVSPNNDYSGIVTYSNILALDDSIPGTFVNGQGNGKSLAQYVNIRVSFFIDYINPISTEVPLTTKLFDNYPNPFNPTTKIKFDLSKSSDIKLIVYDLSGREVNRIANGFTKAGKYDVDFNGSDLPSGVYFCRLTTEYSSQTIKLMLIK